MAGIFLANGRTSVSMPALRSQDHPLHTLRSRKTLLAHKDFLGVNQYCLRPTVQVNDKHHIVNEPRSVPDSMYHSAALPVTIYAGSVLTVTSTANFS
jgi:hypothetical protein